MKDFNDFNFDDLDPEEQEEINREMNENEKLIKNHPLRKKAAQMEETIQTIMESMDEMEKEMFGYRLVESAMIIEAKICGALGTQNWLISMQNAAIIRQHGHDLLIAKHNLEAMTEVDRRYIDLFRNDVEEFQQLFKEWVKSFEKLEREEYEDEWGLFLRQ